MAKLIQNENDRVRALSGYYGERLLTGSSAVGDYFVGFYVITDATISWVNDTPYGDASQTSLAIPAGMSIVGDMTTVVVASGSILAKLG